MTKQLNLETFKKQVFNYEKNEKWLFEGEKPCIIDFYADWCGPCKMVSPILDEISNENENVDIYKVDTEKERELSEMFGIKSIPTLLFVPLSGDPQIVNGALPKKEIEKIIKEIF